MPAQNALPLAVRRMTPTAGARAASSRASTRARQRAGATGLRLPGTLGGDGSRIFQGVDKGAAKGGVQGVALAGPVEGEVQQASLANGMQKVSHGVWVGDRKSV